MKKIFVFISLLFLVCVISAQDNNDDSKKSKFSFGVDLFSDIWLDTPESIEAKIFNRGMSVFGMYEFPISKSDYSFAMGGGITSHNLYIDSYLHTEDGISVFTKFPDSYTVDEIDYKVTVDKNKFVFTYFDVPFEFRLKTEKKFMAALGLKVGFLLQDHSKYKGTRIEELHKTNGGAIKTKVFDYENIAKTRYGVFARIGYKSLNIVGFYSLSTLFDENKGPEMYPISVGISIIPF